MDIVMTGAFETGKGVHITRDALKTLLEQMGHTVGNTLTRSTDVLVSGNTGRHGKTRKLQKAEEYGVEVIDPDSFLKRLMTE